MNLRAHSLIQKHLFNQSDAAVELKWLSPCTARNLRFEEVNLVIDKISLTAKLKYLITTPRKHSTRNMRRRGPIADTFIGCEKVWLNVDASRFVNNE